MPCGLIATGKTREVLAATMSMSPAIIAGKRIFGDPRHRMRRISSGGCSPPFVGQFLVGSCEGRDGACESNVGRRVLFKKCLFIRGSKS